MILQYYQGLETRMNRIAQIYILAFDGKLPALKNPRKSVKACVLKLE